MVHSVLNWIYGFSIKVMFIFKVYIYILILSINLFYSWKKINFKNSSKTTIHHQPLKVMNMQTTFSIYKSQLNSSLNITINPQN